MRGEGVWPGGMRGWGGACVAGGGACVARDMVGQ